MMSCVIIMEIVGPDKVHQDVALSLIDFHNSKKTLDVLNSLAVFVFT
jgi:hypothetical protein